MRAIIKAVASALRCFSARRRLLFLTPARCPFVRLYAYKNTAANAVTGSILISPPDMWFDFVAPSPGCYAYVFTQNFKCLNESYSTAKEIGFRFHAHFCKRDLREESGLRCMTMYGEDISSPDHSSDLKCRAISRCCYDFARKRHYLVVTLCCRYAARSSIKSSRMGFCRPKQKP